MDISRKSISVILFTILTFFLLFFHNNVNLSFEKDSDKNGFIDKNVIPICCAWGPELQDGVLTYSIQSNGDKDEKSTNAVTKAVEKWNENLNGIQLVQTDASYTPTGNENIIISFINDGKKAAGKTTNSVDSNGFIRKSYIALSKEFFNRPFSNSQLEQVAEHELGHVLGLNHVKFNGNLMSTEVNEGSKTITPCLVEAVNIANAWKVKYGGVVIHGPTQSAVACK